MGLFSWNCRRCGHPLLCPGATNEINAWMSQVVAILPPEPGCAAELHAGEYDGYGRIGGASIHDNGEPECYHRACWNLALRPMTFSEPSEPAKDQGWFFEDGAHDMPEPGKGQ